MRKNTFITVILIFLMVLGAGTVFAAKGGGGNGNGNNGGGNGNGGGGNGNEGSGDKKGGLYGELYVIERDDLGLPVLYTWDTGQPVMDMWAGFFQPIAADGSLIPLNDEGEVIDESLTQEIELGRLNLGRSPTDTLKAAFSETCKNVAAADEVYLDVAGRLVLVTYSDTGEDLIKTVDSPRENLALYQQLMIDGNLKNYNEPTIDYPDMNTLSSPDDDADPVFAFKSGAIVNERLWKLVDDSLTKEDLDLAAAFLGAAADKFGKVTVDLVIYLNAFIGVNHSGLPGGFGVFLSFDSQRYHREFFDFRGYTYTRSETYPGDITYIRAIGEGNYVDETRPIIDAVFGGNNYSGDSSTPVKNFAQAADDARQIIWFTHEIVQDVVIELQISGQK